MSLRDQFELSEFAMRYTPVGIGFRVYSGAVTEENYQPSLPKQ
jgi:hypothetical protein